MKTDPPKPPSDPKAPEKNETQKLGEELTREQVVQLCQNENFRYLLNKKAGHAMFVTDEHGNKTAYQFHMPDTKNTSAPEFRPVENITEINRFGMKRYVGESPNKTKMYAKRFHKAIIGENSQEKEIEIGYFSPSEKEGEPFWGSSDKPYPLFDPEKLKKKHKKDLQKELSEIQTRSKGGTTSQVHTESVHFRDANKTRNPDQNKVMGESARDAYEAFYNSWTDELSDQAKVVFKRAFEAPLRDAFKSNWRPEWLHALGWSLTHKDHNPQTKDNLGSAPKWSNTEMMVLERVAKFFAIHAPEDYVVKIKPHFEMLLDSELIKHIHFEVTIEEKNKFIRFLQDLNPFQKNPIFRKPSDLAQATVITQALLKGTEPMTKQNVTTEKTPSQKTGQNSFSIFKPSEQTTSNTPTKQQTSPVKTHKNDHKHHLNVERSIVKIECSTHDFDYDNPWAPPQKRNWSGSGVVVTHNNRKYVLTNAHVAENAVYNTVRFANDRKKFPVKPLCISYQSDLALLDVTDPEFQNIAEAPELGNMVSLKEKVQIMGFPIGGNEVYFSKGITSRIESGEYSISGEDMLQVQIDAAVNSGNSGGPVMDMSGKVVGIAFQGYDFQGGGFMIPIPIVKHFLTEAFSGKPYRGFPSLAMSVSYLENDQQRKHYGLSDHETGVLVTSVAPLSDLKGKIQPKDILLAIDGFAVSGDAKVDIPGIGKRLDYDYITHSKFIGDSVTLTIKRKDASTGIYQKQTITTVLDNVGRDMLMVGAKEHDKMPSYYINSGFAFTPLTLNYLDGRGADLDVVTYDRPNHFLTDVHKQQAGSEFVVIFEVLSCKETEEYDCHVNKIVSKVNGIDVKKFSDLVGAFENNKQDVHVIETLSGQEIILKNMSSQELSDLLKKNHIPYDRSANLRQNTPSPKKLEIITEDSKSRSVVIPLIQDELIEEDTESDLEFDIETPVKELRPEDMPGMKKFRSFVDDMEKRYQDNEEDDLIDFDEIESSSEEISDEDPETSEDESEQETVRRDVKEQKSQYNTRLFRKSRGELTHRNQTFAETYTDEEESEEKPLKRKKI